MIQRILGIAAAAALVLWVPGPGAEAAKYRYGSYRGAGGDQGFYVYAEGGVANPRNTDNVLATVEQIQDFGGGVNVHVPVIPVWDDEFTGRLGAGYAWASGNSLEVSLWAFSAETDASGIGAAGNTIHFAVGPPIFTGGQYVGGSGSPGSFAMATEIDARTIDLTWAKQETLSDQFSMTWSVGLRYANFEETYGGTYDETGAGAVAYDADKSNEGEMLGVRAAVRGRYRVTQRVSLTAALGLSFLDGELTATSALVPSGTANAGVEPTGFAFVEDDSRSGTIRDFDIGATWHSASDRFRVSAGWEQSEWEEIASDLVRNFPGTGAPLRERDAVTFSGYKIGFYFRF